MDDQPGAQQHLARRRSPLLIPLLTIVGLGLLVVGVRTATQESDFRESTEDAVDDDQRFEELCLGSNDRTRRLPVGARSPLDIVRPVLLSVETVYGTVIGSAPRSDGAIEVSIRADNTVSDAGLGLKWLSPPPDQPVGTALGVGTEFLALVDSLEGDQAEVVADGFFFGCSPADTATSYRFEQSKTMFDLEVAVAELRGEVDELTALPRTSGGPVLRIDGDKGSEVVVLLPGGGGSEFSVHSVPFAETDEQLDNGFWPLHFTNGEIIGRVRPGPCFVECAEMLEVEVEAVDSGTPLEGFRAEVLRASEFGQVLAGSFVDPARSPRWLEAENLVVLIQPNGGEDGGGVTARGMDSQTLEVLWEFPSETNMKFVSATDSWVVVNEFSAGSSRLTALDRKGQPVWSREVETDLDTNVPVVNGVMLLAGLDPQVYQGLSMVDGTTVWTYTVPPEFTVQSYGFGSDEDHVVLGLRSSAPEANRFAALGIETGEVRWWAIKSLQGQVGEVDGHLFWSGSGRLARIEKATGETLWEVQRGGFDSLVIDGDTVDLGDAGSFDLETGQRRRAPGRSPAG